MAKKQAKQQNLTSIIERIEPFEEKIGITLQKLSAKLTPPCAYRDKFQLKILGEIVKLSDNSIIDIKYFDIICVVYNSQSEIVATFKPTFIELETFMGFDVFDDYVELDSDDISKIKIFIRIS